MVAKNFYMGSNNKIYLPIISNSEVDKAKRLGSTDWFLVRTNIGIYTKKMGEIGGKLLINLLGITTTIFGFLSNLPNAISAAIGLMSLIWVVYHILDKRETWLMKRSERRKHERENNTTLP